ncbi:MAG: RDD family protein [Gammaproteobacteria bacterium]|nr:RDD family protein [Gammaproteobacteria bacterium]
MRNAPLLRRLGAILYDGLLVLALLFLGTLPFVAIRGGEPVEPGAGTYQVVMLVIAWLFFVGFWTRSGRTLGMQSWRLQLETVDGGRPGIGAATVRFLAAILSWLPLGLGFWWQLWDEENLTWHDRLSATRLRYYPKEGAGQPE